MVSKKKIILIVLIAIIAIIGIYFLINYEQGKASFQGEHNILVLCSDPSENRPGIGSVDMAFVINMNNGNMGNVTPVYPGGLTDPSLDPPADLKAQGVDHWYLHDSLWSSNLENGTKIAQQIVKYNTNMSTDIVVVVTPTAIDAMVNSVGPVYSDGQLVNGSSITFLREDQSNYGATRGDAVSGLADGIKNATQSHNKKAALVKTISEQYAQGNIKVVPADKFNQLISYAGVSNLLG
jgi:hypothetical protein